MRTTPLTVQTPQSSGLPITQVIQNPTIQVASGGTMSTTPSGGISASVANQLPQQPATIQTHQSAGTIQTVKIAGQTQVLFNLHLGDNSEKRLLYIAFSIRIHRKGPRFI